jgi:hypothetical protein
VYALRWWDQPAWWTRRAINMFVSDVNIQPNRTGLPGIASLESIVGVPAKNKLEHVARMSNLTNSGPEDLVSGSKERKSVLINLAKGLTFPVDRSLVKPKLREEVAQHLGVDWDESCFSTRSTITLEGLVSLLEGGEKWLLSHGHPVGLPKRAFDSPRDKASASCPS